MSIYKNNPGVRLAIKVTPNAGRNEITGLKDGFLQVRVTAAPEKGKANKAVMDLLAEKWGLRKSSITIIKGETSRNKIVLINGLNSEDISSILKWVKRERG